MDLEATISEINLLPVSDRIGFVQRILHGIAQEDADLEGRELSDEFKAEIDRRIALADADPGRGIPWEEVEAEMIAREQR